VRSYLNTACTAPASVFARLLRGAQHHLRDLSTTNKGAYLRLEQSLQDIQSNLPPQFPRMLLLIDQGTFMLGYYHQKADNSKAARAAWAAKKGASSQPPETGLTPQTK
jgi:CRISPR-associated protein Csd1